MEKHDGLFLKELIRSVRKELIDSDTERIQSGDDPLFSVGKVTIEVHFVVTKSREGGLGLNLKVITAEGSKEYEEQQVQKVTIELNSLARIKSGMGESWGHSEGRSWTESEGESYNRGHLQPPGPETEPYRPGDTRDMHKQ